MSQITEGTYARLVTYNYNKILSVSVAQDMLRKVCLNFIEKLTMTFQIYCIMMLTKCKRLWRWNKVYMPVMSQKT